MRGSLAAASHSRAAMAAPPPVCGRGRRHLPPWGKAFSFRKRVILDVDRALVLTVAVGAGAAELTVGAGGSAAGAERLGVNAAAVQILRHIDEKSVQMVADADSLAVSASVLLAFSGLPVLALKDSGTNSPVPFVSMAR